MKTIILAAGEGARMRPLTHGRPKVMLPIANKPILEHLLINAHHAGLTDFIFIVSYHKETIIDYFQHGDPWDVTIDYVDQRQPQGTAHAIKQIRDHVDDHFLVLSGDTITSTTDIKALADTSPNTIGIKQVDHPEEYGVVELDNHTITAIHEKTPQPPTNLINTGNYHLDETIFTAINTTAKSHRHEYEITTSFHHLIQQNNSPQAHPLKETIDISRPWDLLTTNTVLLKQLKPDHNNATIEPNVTLNGPVSIGADTHIMNGTYIQGPAIIGTNCTIGPNTYIRPYTSIGNHCHIGNATEIKNSIIMHHSNCPHQNYVGDSIIGEHCNFGAGTRIANLRLDKQPITVTTQGHKINTGRRKLGGIIADHVQTGINASINPGTIIGDHVFIGPNAFANGEITAHSNIM